ncbi:kinesin-like protein KIF17 isoform X2 [Stigmatopora argus]
MGSESVKVVVRCRPLSDKEEALGSKMVLSMDLQLCQCFIEKPASGHEPSKQFTFDGTYFTQQTTEQMYNESAYPLVEGVIEGYNGTIFAYGQTGSGKSFTMQGVSEPPTQKGVIPRAFEHIFESIQCAENTKFLVRVSYLEIYNEEIRDLLGNNTKQRLELKEHPERGVYARDLSMHTVHGVSGCEVVMERGWRNRAVAATLMNKDSSRSHSIFSIHLEMCRTDASGRDHLRAGKLNLVDLAGSERQSKTGATGERLREASKINLSLSALGNVISALADGRSRHVPYRDSKLTRLLRDSLGGNTRTLMVACLSPSGADYEETLSTLRYANRAKSIQNRPRVNEDPKDALLRQYREEIEKLRGLLSAPAAPLLGDAALTTGGNLAAQRREELSGSVDGEKEKLRKDYEERLARLQADYNAERESKTMLEEDMAALRASYHAELSSLEKVKSSSGSSKPNNENDADVSLSSQNDENGSLIHLRKLRHSTTPRDAPQIQTNPDEVPEEPSGVGTNADTEQKEALKRLQKLEQEMVGGEQARNQELKQRQRQRRELADRRKAQLVKALAVDGDQSDHVLFSVYDSIQEELHAKGHMLLKVQGKLKAAKLEIRDLQGEFEEERKDYLCSIRRLEREGQLLHGLLERAVSLVRRDCNYSSLERLKREAAWDEESATWSLPDVTLQRTMLPSAVTSKQSPPRGPIPNSQASPVEEDRYKEVLERSDSENIANAYFKAKRPGRLLGAETAAGCDGHSPSSSDGSPHFDVNASLPRPFRLESLTVAASRGKAKGKKKKSPL